MAAPADHPFADYAAYAATLAPGETVTYHHGPSLAAVAAYDPDMARVREGFLALGTPVDEHIRPIQDHQTDGSADTPPYGLGMGYLTQKKVRDGETTKFAYRFTRAGSADAAEGQDTAPAPAGDTVRPTAMPEDGVLQAAG